MEKRIRLTTRLAAETKKDKPPKKGDVHREIPAEMEYDKSKLKHLKKIIHNINVSVGNLMGASKEFSLMKGPEISPDGLLGGNGYIKTLREIKDTLSETVHSLSDLGDTLVDELNNPKWGLKEKEQEDLEKEKEEIDEKQQEIEETLNEETEDVSKEEEPPEEEEPSEEEQKSKEEPPPPTPVDDQVNNETLMKESAEGISSQDVHDSSEVSVEKEAADMRESLDRYLSSIEVDQTRKILSKKVLAGLLN